jgi:hypothetical protein
MAMFKLVLAILLLNMPSANASSSHPRDIAESFYTWLIKYDGGGLPSQTALKAIEPNISRELLTLLRKATAVEKRCVASTPRNLKPMIFEGSLFVDNYEGTTKVKSMELEQIGLGILVTSHLEFKDPRWEVDAIDWTDQLLLIQESEKWVVGDTKPPGSPNSLVRKLKKYIRAACRA